MFFPAVIHTIYKQYVLELRVNNCKQTRVFVLKYQSCNVLQHWVSSSEHQGISLRGTQGKTPPR